MVGVNGLKLSGGQRARVVLARAIYSNADIFLLDNIFSSLDYEVAETIFTKLIIKTLLPLGKTVLLVTNNYSLVDGNHNIIYINNGKLEQH